jgi:hypothetical protein
MYDVDALIDPLFLTGQCDPGTIADGGLVAATSDQGGAPNYVGTVFTGSAFTSNAARDSDSVFLAVNNRGHAVGARDTHADVFIAVWSDGTSLVDLPVPSPGVAIDINDSEEVIGWDATDPRGFLLDRRTGALTRIPPPPGEMGCQPKAINASGLIVGRSDLGGFVHGGGSSRSLGAIDALDVNNQGVACGSISTGPLMAAPALCDTTQASPMVAVQPIPSGFSNAVFAGINDAGVAVGQAWGANLADSAAFICVNGISTDLNTLVDTPGWDLIAAHAINGAGQIVGLGWFNSRLLGFVASPVRKRNPFEALASAELMAILLGGVIVDGGGLAIVGGKPRPVGPWGPLTEADGAKADAILLLALDEAAKRISDTATRASVRKALIRGAESATKALSKAASSKSSGPSSGERQAVIRTAGRATSAAPRAGGQSVKARMLGKLQRLQERK